MQATIGGGGIDGRQPTWIGALLTALPLLIIVETAGATAIAVGAAQEGGGFPSLMMWLLPLALVLAVVLFFMRQSQGRTNDANQTMAFTRSRARRITADRPLVTFRDVAGADEAKVELQEVVEFLKFPGKFKAVGARIPKGLLLVGPPGTGKTLLARAVAGEAGVPFFSISASEFVELFVGVGASRVRDLFNQAKDSAPCIVFIDEIDAVGRQRGLGVGGGHEEREQTLNQVLVEMDGFDRHDNVIVMAATNRSDVLDPALTRPGRFDRRVTLDLPDVNGRLAILRVHARGKPLASGVRLDQLAKETSGFSGADLENVMNEAAILAARRGRLIIEQDSLEEAVARVVTGPQRVGRLMSARERGIIAYHEAGHALVAYYLPHADPIHKVSIVSRGASGGQTWLLPDEDRHLWTRSQLLDTLAFALGGRAAEEAVFGEPSTGSGSDLQQATHVARRMVSEFGMGETVGPGGVSPQPIVGRVGDGTAGVGEQGESGRIGGRLADRIDEEAAKLVAKAHARARDLVSLHRAELDLLAEGLLQKETLHAAEVIAILEKRQETAG